MNSFCVGIVTVLAVFAGTAFSRISQDQFYELFNARVPMPEMLAAVYDNCPTVQLQHMQSIEDHITRGDEYADYARDLKKAAQKILNSGLREMGQEPVEIMQYMQAASDLASGNQVENKQLENVIKQCLENGQKLMEASDEEKQFHFNKMVEAASTRDDDTYEGKEQDASSHESIQLGKPHSEEIEEDGDDFSSKQVTGRHDSAQRRIRYTSASSAEAEGNEED